MYNNAYKIRITHNMGWYAASNESNEYIVVEAMGHDFEAEEMICIVQGQVYNIDRKELTTSIIQAHTSRNSALNFLKSLK